MNLVILKGRLTKSPTLLFGKSGTAYTSINIAVDRYSKDKNSNADFINCIAFGKTAELIAERFTKGQEILIEGNLKIDVFEKDDKREYKTFVLIQRVEFCGSKKDKDEDDDGRDIYDTDVFLF
jgi:single-stranded DNA-binding protein